MHHTRELFIVVALAVGAASCAGADSTATDPATSDTDAAATSTSGADSHSGGTADGSASAGASATADASADAGVQDSAQDSAQDESDATASSGSSSAAGSRVADYLGSAAFAVQGRGAAVGFDPETVAAEQRLVEVEVQRCMRAQGFDYVPEEAGDGLRLFAAAANQGLDPADAAATIGFGISTGFDELFAGDIELDAASSPNDELVAELSEAEADAWQLALRGAPPERDGQGRLIDPETGEPIEGRPGQVTGGCRLEAQIAVRGDLTDLDGLADAWAALEDRIEADPELAAIDRAWAACMLERGFDHDTPADARASIRERFQPLLASFAASAAGDDRGRGQRGAGALRAIIDQGLTDEQAAELDDLQDLEVATAVAAHECGADSAAEAAEIRARYEAAFVDENRAALEAFAE